jgi:type VI secretion system protein ImpC
MSQRGTVLSMFMSTQTLNSPRVYDNEDATTAAMLGARLPYLFAIARFTHYLKCIVRDRIGSYMERDTLQRSLQAWLLNYVDPDPVNSSDAVKARLPLASADVLIEELEGSPGAMSAKIYLRPHYQLEGLTTSLRLVTRLPNVFA